MALFWMAVAIIAVCYWFFRSPLSGAVADTIRGDARTGSRLEERLRDFARHVTEELDGIRNDLAELEERLDFTERTLTQMRRRDALPAHRKAGS
jgi:Tfp pilus assembly protein PilO